MPRFFTLQEAGETLEKIRPWMEDIQTIRRAVLAKQPDIWPAIERSAGNGGNPLVDVVADLPASHRFFAGGSTTVRGFQLDRLGVREILNEDGLSDGGNALVVLNAEVRFSAGELFGRNLTLVGFTDAGNVFDRIGDLSLRRLRATAGFGFRYDSPFGPVRLDFGFKLDRFTFAKGRERRWEFHLSLGEVF